MATMVKEKRKEKKKTKEKSLKREINQELLDSKNIELKDEPKVTPTDLVKDILKENFTVNTSEGNSIFNVEENQEEIYKQLQQESIQDEYNNQEPNQSEGTVGSTTDVNKINVDKQNIDPIITLENEEINEQLVDDNQAIQTKEEENVIPSAPVFEEESVTFVSSQVVVGPEILVEKVRSKAECLSLEEAVRIFGGKEISEVRLISEKEEAIVEAGPVSGPEHPLVDLLSSFRSSLNALDRSRITISNSIIEEEKSRSSLWKVEKRRVCVSEKCPCGSTVTLQASYQHAELQKEKIPAARMRLEALSREVQDSYCHHQHSALLAYCQIEELVYETTKCNKGEIRETLSLVLQALRLSDGASEAYSSALQRWAVALSAALLDGRDLRQLIFLIHHLFRQTRSVRWASRVIRVLVSDASSAARAVALLELVLARSGLETAVECTEELDDVWEEVGRKGEGSAVIEGRLRERDALALLSTLPLKQMVAKIVLFARSDVSNTRDGEWGDTFGGHGVLKAACGVRTLLSVVQRALQSHPHYDRLRGALRNVCVCALHALASLHMQSRSYYHPDVEIKLAAELEACFASGLALLDPTQLQELPTTLLSEDSAKEYCTNLMIGMHATTPVETCEVPCDVRVRTLVRATQDRAHDRVLARTLLLFLCQTAIKRKPQSCKHPCEVASREGLPLLLTTHPYLHATALHTLADLNQAEPIDPLAVGYLSVREWRPSVEEVVSVLEDWWRRCPQLVQHLLLHMDYTPHLGVSLDAQLAIGQWLCGIASPPTEAPEWAWRVLKALRVHRSHWSLPLEAPPPEWEREGLLPTAFALVATNWGHSVPVICSEGVCALVRVARARAPFAAHGLALLMRVMRQSPESVALTPEFTEAISAIVGAGPSLMARALGRGGPSGAEILQQILLEEISTSQSQYSVGVVGPWLRGLWAPTLPSVARELLDTAMRASKDWPALDNAVADILQGEGSKDLIAETLRDSSVAPLLCEALLRGLHARSEASTTWPRLLEALQHQRGSNQRAHVDNALRQIGIVMNSEELVVYRVANAALNAPFQHPAHLTLWRLFFHLYLQRPPSSPQEATPPIGPMFFSGIIKSRIFGHLKKRLQDTISYHQTQAERLKPQVETVQNIEVPTSSRNTKEQTDSKVFKTLSINDLTGEERESSTETDTDSSGDEGTLAKEENIVRDSEASSRETFHLYCYHVAAEKLVREYSRWLEEGDKVRSSPHHADIARFISEQGLNAAWRSSLPNRSPGASPPQPRAPRKPPPTYLQLAIDSVLRINDRSSTRSRLPLLKPPLEDQINLGNPRVIFDLVGTHLKDIEALAREWADEVDRLSKLDGKVWEFVGALRVRRPLPPVLKSCEKKCKPIKFIIKRDEWVISTGAEQGILENRRGAMTVLRRLSRPRPRAARAAAALPTLARHVRSSETARRVAERAGLCADPASNCAPARLAVTALVDLLAERWLCSDAASCGVLVGKWACGGEGLRRLCSALVRPHSLAPQAASQLYRAVVEAPLPPHAAFSYLSRFEMSSWAEKVDFAEREKILDVLVKAAQRWGPYPDPEYNVLLELIGVHANAVCGGSALCALVLKCAKASACASLPASFCAHVARATQVHAHALDSNQLGGLLRELGAIWWDVRTAAKDAQIYELYASCVADLLHTLQLAFVAATQQLGHDTEQLSWFAWCSLRESWSPWVQPGSAPPLLPTSQGSEAYSEMVHRFTDLVQATMEECPDGQEYILKYVWEWSVHTYLSLARVGTQEDRVQLSALLAALATLQWERPWMHASCLPLALQVSRSADKEISTWCSATWRRVEASQWLRGLPDDQTAPHVAALLELFCSPHVQLSSRTVEEAGNLPWWRLPFAALDSAWEQFFVNHHNPAVPYHEVSQFRILLTASQLVGSRGVHSAGSREKRCRSVSQWVRAAATPSLLTHVPKHAGCVLSTITDLAPHIEDSEGELEELLSRAIVIMCFEPAAGAALPVWQHWISTCDTRSRLACASAVASLTTLEYFAPLAEATAKAHMTNNGGWESIRARWSSCAWDACAACSACSSRSYWHAAYALMPESNMADAEASEMASKAYVAVLRSLAAHELNADDDTPILAVWVCVGCRLAKMEPGSSEGEAGRSLLSRWAAEPRRSILQVVGIQQHHAARIRLLCRLAQCILDPSSDSLVKAYESSCAAVLGSSPSDVTSWAKAPLALHLPRLALRLFPQNEAYFKKELEVYDKI